MKHSSLKRAVACFLVASLHTILNGQNGVYIISSSVGDGDYKEQQEVKVIPPNGKVSSSATQGHLFIDKNMMMLNAVSPSPNTPASIPAHDKNLPVGTLDGVSNVDLNGAANYSVKLDIPPGTNGMIPEVSVQYNSNGGDNQLGLGWSIGGISVIKRENHAIFCDNFTKSFDPLWVNYWSSVAGNPVAPLYLDGVKLVPDLNTNNTFFLENDNFSRITYDASVDFFLVETKSGVKMEYGRNTATNKSLQKIVGGTKDYAWYLNKVYDNYGNYVEYFYHNLNNEMAIKEIKYTGNSNSGQAPYNSVKFYYNYRVDAQTKYFYDDVVDKKLQLREIETFCEDASVFRYQFKYAYEDFNYLTSITKVAADDSQYNPTYFAYGVTAGPKLTQNTALLKSGNTYFDPTQDYVTADFNNDGKTDILEFHIMNGSTDPGNGFKVYDSWKLFLNTNNGQEFELQQTQTLGVGTYAAAFLGSYSYAFGLHTSPNGIEIGDINGDGYMDLVYAISGNNPLVTVAAFVFNPTTNVLDPLTLTTNAAGSCQNGNFSFRQSETGYSFNPQNGLSPGSPGNTSMTMGDFNGDGKSELLTFFKKPGSNAEIALFFFDNFADPSKTAVNNLGALHSMHKDGSTPWVSMIGSAQPVSLNRYSGFSAADYNGDGKTDLIAYRDADNSNLMRLVILEIDLSHYSIDIDLSCSLSIREIAQYPIASQQFPADHSSSGDFNGDGYLDFISHPYLNGLESSISFGTGASFTQNQNQTNIGRRGLLKKFIALDVNADGISDLVKLETYANLDVTAEVILGQNITKNVAFENYGTIGVAPGNDNTNLCGMPPNKDYLHPLCNYDYDANGETQGNCLNPNLDPDDVFDSDPNKIPFYGVGDFDGDGYNDIIYRKGCANGPFFQIIYFKHKYQNKFITRVVDGQNKKVDFTYSTIAKANYSKSNTVYIYPNVRVNYPFNIVTAQTFLSGANLNGTTTNETINYFYEDLAVNKLGRGFLGFQKVKKVNALTSRSFEQTFVIDPTYFIKLPYQDKTFSGIQSLGTITYNYGLVNKNVVGLLSQSVRKRYQLHLNSSSELNVIRNITTNSAFTYDSDGNITQSSINIVGKKQTTVAYNSYVNAGSWLPNKPQTVITQNVYTGQSPMHTKQMDYSYDLTKGHNLTETSYISQQKSVLITKQYDANTGVLLQTIITAPNEPSPPTPIVTANAYDPKFRFVTSETKSLNYANSIEYNYKLGVPLKTTTSDGLVTNMYYDAFGRLKKIIDPQSNVITKAINWYTTADAQLGDPNPVNVDLTTYFTEVKQAGTPTTRSYYDINGRLVKTDVEGFNTNVSNLTDYDIFGNVKKEYGPFFVPLPPLTPVVVKTNNYSAALNELTSVVISDGTINNTNNITYNYVTASGDLIVTTTGPDGKVTSQKTDAAGRLIETVDNGGTLNFSYYNNEQINETSLNGTVIKKMVYDAYDFPYQEIEKNSGTKQFDYNSFGWAKASTDANGTTSTFAYDALGRLTTEAIGPDSYIYTYINAGNGKGQIEKMQASYGPEFSYNYDNLGRLTQSEEKINSVTYINKYSYDNLNHLIKQVYPNNFTIKRNYNLKGYPTTIVADATNETIWQANEMDHFGNYTKYTNGNAIQTTQTYNSLGLPQSIVAGNIQDLVFDINTQNGNLNKITDNVKNNIEEYQYDNLDRLTQIKLNGSLSPFAISYDTKGNITSKFDAGSLTAGPIKHNQTIAAGNANAVISNAQQDIIYTPFNKTKHITEGINEIDIVYGPSKERMQTTFWQSGAVAKIRRYISQSEIELDGSNAETQTINYINAPSGLCAMQVVQGNNKAIYYPYFDQLGSILTVTDKLGNVVAEQNFDAWGRRRNANTWLYTSLNAIPSWLSRGYTGHEMLEQFDLINMNGRMYDPKLGRMLSVDPVLQGENGTQAYNKYSYCLNNPLKYTDPTGYITGSAVLNSFWGSGGPGGAFVSTMHSLGSFIDPSSSAPVNDGNGSAIWGSSFDGNLTTGPGQIPKQSGAGGVSAAYESEAARSKETAMLLGGQNLYYIRTVDGSGKIHNFYTTLTRVVREYTKPKEALDEAYLGGYVSGEASVNNLGNGSCPECLDASTLGKNIGGMSYPGGNNPRSINGDYNYSYIPENIAEYPAIGHDRRYDNLGVTGASGLFTDSRAIGADVRFVAEEMAIALNPTVGLQDRITAAFLGSSLAIAAFPKTMLKLITPNGMGEIQVWYNFSNKGANNIPTKHKH